MPYAPYISAVSVARSFGVSIEPRKLNDGQMNMMHMNVKARTMPFYLLQTIEHIINQRKTILLLEGEHKNESVLQVNPGIIRCSN